MKQIDDFLDRITMYRLVLYYLILLVSNAFILVLFGVLPYTPVSFLSSVIIFLVVSWITNKVFAYVFEAPTNVESVYITALILVLIFTPPHRVDTFILLAWVAVWSMASKYIFAIGKKHIFNPVAIAAVITSFVINQSASWWVGNTWMLLAVVVGGLLIVRKIRRFTLVLSFMITAVVTTSLFVLFRGGDLLGTIEKFALGSSLFFFAFIMLTEPLTTPPRKKMQIIYGCIVGFLFAPPIHLGSFYSTPELALVLGNLYSYYVSPKYKLILKLKEKIATGTDLVDFIFKPGNKFNFLPGQYMEWTLAHPRTDSRGNRRYFTIASSPTEEDLRLGIKFYPEGSSFKKALITMEGPTKIVGTGISGDFTLPADVNQKLVFIAGGIGITPFRSMLKYLLDTKQPRPIVLLYANKSADEIVYVDVFNQAQEELGVKVVYTLTDSSKIPSSWQGSVGRISAEMIKREVPDFMERSFYLSGPHAMVVAYEETLLKMGISAQKIKKDFFPGFI